MTWLEILIGLVIIILVFLPPKYGPAIRLKERALKRRKSKK